MNNLINIVLCSDDNYAQHIAVVIASIMAKTKERVCFYVINDNISKDKIEKLKNTADTFKAQIEFITVSEDKFINVYLSGHVSKAAYFRLALADILRNDIEKVIYLDVDLLVFDDINKLWQIDLENLPLAAVPDYGIMASVRLCKQKKQVIGLPVGEKYFNSGVLIIDVDLWRKYNYSSRVIKLASTAHLPHHDQDALNKVFMDNWVELPLRWNVIPPVYNLFIKILLNKKFRKKAINARKNIAIMHYAGRYKPWEFTLHKGFNEKYYEYLQLTAFKNEKMPQPNKNMNGKSIFRQMVRLKIADFWTKIF